jgi:S1-C subfamily serine protease
MHRRMLSAMKYKISVSNDRSYLIDWYKRKHRIVGFKMVKKADLGILRVKLIKDLPTYRIATEMPQKGEKVYNTASPLGFFSGNVLGLYEGRYLGKKVIPIKGYKSLMAVYTIPVIGGSSGSPILNKCGEVIGIVSSVHRRFHHISFGVPLSAIRSAMYK